MPAEAASPIIAPAWLASLSHWSRKTTTKSAVIANEMPSTSMARALPKRLPSVQPSIQYDWLSTLTQVMNHPSSTPSGARVERLIENVSSHMAKMRYGRLRPMLRNRSSIEMP